MSDDSRLRSCSEIFVLTSVARYATTQVKKKQFRNNYVSYFTYVEWSGDLTLLSINGKLISQTLYQFVAYFCMEFCDL